MSTYDERVKKINARIIAERNERDAWNASKDKRILGNVSSWIMLALGVLSTLAVDMEFAGYVLMACLFVTVVAYWILHHSWQQKYFKQVTHQEEDPQKE